ncbi:MAG: endonuclease/exonuclease/phosphatase family protein [Ginsengibacter sp.]
MKKFRRRRKPGLFRQILVFLNVGIILAYLASCLVPFINTGENWLLAFPGLVFPFIFFGLVIFIILWIFLKSKWWWISLIVLVVGLQQILAVFSFHIPERFSYNKSPETLRVFQWNVTSWDEGDKKELGGASYRPFMLDLVKKDNADVLCLQEFFEAKDTGYYKSNISALHEMGYPYYYFVPLSNSREDLPTGTAIFSKYPIIDSASFKYKINYTGDHLLYADIKFKNEIFRIYTTHLQPVYFDNSEYEISNWMQPEKESDIGYFHSLFSRLRSGFEYRYTQSVYVHKKMQESPYPSIMCGDFNDVPNSNTYFTVKGNLRDVFLKKGSGFGQTIPFFSQMLRIDYIFADKKFKVTQFHIDHVNYSNHFPLVTDLDFSNIK